MARDEVFDRHVGVLLCTFVQLPDSHTEGIIPQVVDVGAPEEGTMFLNLGLLLVESAVSRCVSSRRMDDASPFAR